MSPFHSRARRGDDPYLEWKVGLFSVAAVTGLAGIYFDERWMGFTAIGLLAVAMAVGVAGRRVERAEAAAADEADEVD